MSNAADGGLAFDRATVRSFDKDGHLHVAESNISKATVNPYRGSEIPDWQALGLDPDRIYKLLRDPKELEKAAGSFNGKPLLFSHKATTAENHQTGDVVGTIMNPRWEAPHLKAELVVWPADAIKAIEDESQKALSCGYRYRADMTPGTYDGDAYDGVMRDIAGNHVALVAEGRAGGDVVVGDSAFIEKELGGSAGREPEQFEAQQENDMAKTHVLSRKAAATIGALSVYLNPKLATDAKMPDLSALLAKVTPKNFAASKPTIAADIKKALTGKLAKDASLDDLTQLLDNLDAVEPNEATDEEARSEDRERAKDGSPLDQVKELLSQLSDEDKAALAALIVPAAADEEDEEAKRKAEAEAKEKQAMDTATWQKKVDKMAADSAKAIKDAIAAERANQTAIRAAFDEVRPLVGELHIAADSAADIYKHVLEMRGVDVVGVDPSAFRAMVGLLSKPGKSAPAIAADAAANKSYVERFPNANRLKK